MRAWILFTAAAAALAPFAAAGGQDVPVAMVFNVFASPEVAVPVGVPVTFVSVHDYHYVATGGYDLLARAGEPNDLGNEDGDPDTFGVFVDEGDSWSHAFTKPGSYPIYCAVHEQLAMIGRIDVV